MIFRESQYFNLNRILLAAIGLWPYQQSKFVRLQCIIISIILTAGIIFQITTLVTLKCTPDLVIKILSSVSFFSIFIIKYGSFYINIEAVKNLLEQLQRIYNELTDENEIAIIQKYDCNAKRYTAALTILAVCCVTVLIITQIWSDVLDIILPINVSRPRHLLILTEYFIDQEKYFYLIQLHVNTTLCTGAIAMLAIGTLLITYLQHTCGMFRIASYRIEQAMNINILQNISLKNNTLISEDLICAVHIHRQAMKLSTQMLSRFEVMMFCLIIFEVTSLSLNLFRIFQIVSFGDDIKEFLMPSVYVTINILYMFLANYMGQNVTDHNNHVFTTAYNVQWYIAPLHVQKLILFLLRKGADNFTLNVGGLFVASIECFAALVKTSVSYFTVIYSTR